MAPESQRLDGQVAIVTGAGRGFGRAIAARLAEAGAAVAVTARTAAQLDETVTQIEAAGGKAFAITADVANRDDVARVVRRASERFGPISLVVNNAGVPDPFGPLWTIDPDRWWEAQAVHIRAPMLFLREVLPQMVAARTGRVILVSAIAARVIAKNLSAYCVGKNAQARLAQLAAHEAKEHGVSVFAIDPGFVVTAIADQTMNSPDAQRWLPGMVKRLRERKGAPDDGRDLARCAQRCVDLASGRFDALSGGYMELDDDLEAWLQGSPPVRKEEYR
ncbi:MAG TPA: SDR family oxidoreductase [Steroidobacteraceae bacterium]|nr:SDR family oxidoreductase [Steroidobacteraceae bacterium]